jgi:hypothetical protein
VTYSTTTQTWIFFGTVNDEHAAGLTVTLSNLPNVGSVTELVASDDTFSYSLQAPATANNVVSASVTDSWGAVSSTVTVTM